MVPAHGHGAPGVGGAEERHERSWREVLANLLFPPRCLGCSRRGVALCRTCRGRLPYLPAHLCFRCSRPTPAGGLCQRCSTKSSSLRGVRAVFSFEGAIRNGIHLLKYRGARYLGPVLAEFMTWHLARRPLAVDAVVPVPLSADRLRVRGYNQAELLAEPVAQFLGAALRPELLVRVRATAPQAELAALQRWANVRGAFACPQPGAETPSRVLLVDDVHTTGATVQACGQALRAGGASAVWALALAREL